MRALLVTDIQEDFCPPNGSLAVKGGRDIIPLINSLLRLSDVFPVRIASMDWHPQDHISFASNHVGKTPFQDKIVLTNPDNPWEKINSELWPDHCVQQSPGAQLVADLDVSLIQDIIKKGTDSKCEMYSAFGGPFQDPRGFGDTGLARMLASKGVKQLWVVGLAADYCVKSTALDAVKYGFDAFIIEEATRAVDQSDWDVRLRQQLNEAGVHVVSTAGPELQALGVKHIN